MLIQLNYKLFSLIRQDSLDSNLDMQPRKREPLDCNARPCRPGIFQVFPGNWYDYMCNSLAVLLNLVSRNLDYCHPISLFPPTSSPFCYVEAYLQNSNMLPGIVSQPRGFQTFFHVVNPSVISSARSTGTVPSALIPIWPPTIIVREFGGIITAWLRPKCLAASSPGPGQLWNWNPWDHSFDMRPAIVRLLLSSKLSRWYGSSREYDERGS